LWMLDVAIAPTVRSLRIRLAVGSQFRVAIAAPWDFED
jgi:hypothetical protein